MKNKKLFNENFVNLNKKRNYSLSGCILNLGVVPLLLFSAFLFAPALVFLADRLFLVTRVLETILLRPYKIFRSQLLPTYCPIVKVLFTLSFAPCVLAEINSPNLLKSPKSLETIVISRGEQKELKSAAFAKISIGNKEVLAHKYMPKAGKILIKGRRLGFSDLTVWEKNHKKSFHIYVFSKRKYLEMAHLIKNLEELPLKVSHQGQSIHVQGKLSKMGQYQSLVRVISKNPDKISVSVELEKRLQNDIIADIYNELEADYISNIKCISKAHLFVCTIPSTAQLSKKRKELLQKKYLIEFFENKLEKLNTNFTATLNIYHFQSEDQQGVLLGTEGVDTNWDQILSKGLDGILKQRSFKLGAADSKIETFAQPIISIMLGSPATFQMGTEVPITQSNNDRQYTDWKFTGLKGVFNLSKNQDFYLLKYSAELSFPDFSGTKEESVVKIELGKAKKVFGLIFKYQSDTSRSLPLLGKIPGIGKLFTSPESANHWHQIIGVVNIAKEESNES
jgi:CHAT domain-containing protein